MALQVVHHLSYGDPSARPACHGRAGNMVVDSTIYVCMVGRLKQNSDRGYVMDVKSINCCRAEGGFRVAAGTDVNQTGSAGKLQAAFQGLTERKKGGYLPTLLPLIKNGGSSAQGDLGKTPRSADGVGSVTIYIPGLTS